VDVERVVADGDRKLLADERQVAAEFEEEIAEVGEDRLAELLLGVLVAQPEELQDVVVLERQQVALLGVIGQALFWVAPDRHVPQVQAGIDLPAEFADRPAFAGRHLQIEVAFGGIGDGPDQNVMMRPRKARDQLGDVCIQVLSEHGGTLSGQRPDFFIAIGIRCVSRRGRGRLRPIPTFGNSSGRWPDFLVAGKSSGEPAVEIAAAHEKLPHAEDVVAAQSLHVRERQSQVLGELLDHRVAPFRVLLLLDDNAADVPVEADQLAIHGRQSAMPRVGDQPFHIRQYVDIIRRRVATLGSR